MAATRTGSATNSAAAGGRHDEHDDPDRGVNAVHDEGMATETETFWARRRDFDPPDDEDAAGGDDGKQLMLLADISSPEIRPAY